MASDVDALARHRATRFTQMNANLMRATGLEAARDERSPHESLDGLDMRDGLAGTGGFAAVTPSRRAA
jgi:hypothetical protein